MYKKLTQTTLLALLLISGTLLATSCSNGAPSRLAAKNIEEIKDKLETQEEKLARLNTVPIPQIIKKLQEAFIANSPEMLELYNHEFRLLLQFRDSQDNRETDRQLKKHYPSLTSKVEEKENAVNDRINALDTMINIIKSNKTPTDADFKQEILTGKKVIEAEISMFKELLKLQK